MKNNFEPFDNYRGIDAWLRNLKFSTFSIVVKIQQFSYLKLIGTCLDSSAMECVALNENEFLARIFRRAGLPSDMTSRLDFSVAYVSGVEFRMETQIDTKILMFSRCWFAEDGSEMWKVSKRTCWATALPNRCFVFLCFISSLPSPSWLAWLKIRQLCHHAFKSGIFFRWKIIDNLSYRKV